MGASYDAGLVLGLQGVDLLLQRDAGQEVGDAGVVGEGGVEERVRVGCHRGRRGDGGEEQGG